MIDQERQTEGEREGGGREGADYGIEGKMVLASLSRRGLLLTPLGGCPSLLGLGHYDFAWEGGKDQCPVTSNCSF